MDSDRPDELRKAVELMRGGDSGAARTLLIDHVMHNPNSELGWMLLSYVLADRAQQVDCLERVLRINPHNEKARERLAELITPPPPVRAGTPPAIPAAEEKASAPPFVTEEEATSEPVVSGPETAPHGDSALVSRLRAAAEQAPLIEDEDEDEEEPLEAPIVWADRLPPDAAPSFEPAAAPPAPPTPPASTEGKPEEQAGEGASPKKRRPRWLTVVLILGGITVACGAIAVVASLLVPGLLLQQLISSPTTAALPLETATFIAPAWTLPPKWTDTPTFTPSPTRTATPVPSPSATPAFATPNATTSVSMDLIERQVANLRGLSIAEDVPRYVISRTEAERVLSESFYATSSVAEMADEARVLTVLGLIKPTYDLVRYSLNRMADGVGGFYFPESDQLFVIGSGFTGLERFIYSHEFTHVLVDQHFGLDKLGVYPECIGDEQRCDAIRALAEGDATLVMQTWLEEDATPQDVLDLSRYRPQAFVIPEAFPPPFVEKDVNFPYEQGMAFVTFLHDRGSWAEVNRAYSSLPASTEQILHPAKYVAGELPVTVNLPDLTSAAGEGWRMIKQNSLGEWRTYLILRSGADTGAQLTDKLSASVASGWGGDQYVVFSDEQNLHLILVARWAWDTATDAKDFQAAFKSYLGKRFLGATVNGVASDCWSVNEQTTCMYSSSDEVLWILAPDMEKVTGLKALFPTFK